MLEIIGGLFVGYVLWSILKGVLSGSVRGTMMRSVEHAVRQGVPNDFAKKMIAQREVMKQAVKTMGIHSPGFMGKDVYEQYGEALVMLYTGYLSEHE